VISDPVGEPAIGCPFERSWTASTLEPPSPGLHAATHYLILRMSQTGTATRLNGHSMVGKLQRVLVCSPRAAGWDQPAKAAQWRELGFLHALNFAEAQRQHEILCRELETAGADVIELPAAPEFSIDAVYAHDASLPTDFGLVLMRMGKENRVVEGRLHASFSERIDVPILGRIVEPGTTEAGDIVWLDSKTLFIGQGFRTNAEGIRQMRAMLEPHGVEVLAVPLPYGRGPAACLHLMSLMSMLDERTILVDLPWLAVETVKLLQARGFRMIEIDGSERDTLACNVLALGENRLLAIEENRKTNERLCAAGFDLRTLPGTELCINGGGGPTCLTRPILRA